MGDGRHHYIVFGTVAGYCGIAWNDVGITRVQLPDRSAEATERRLLRWLPGAEPGAPTAQVTEAVTAVRQYFEGEKVDFDLIDSEKGPKAQNVQRGPRLPMGAVYHRRSRKERPRGRG